MMNDVFHYAAQFRQLRTNYTHQHNQSPHKFIFLLSIIRLYEEGVLQNPQIALTDSLRMAFEREWALWVRNPHHQMNVGLPLYHMKSETFWRFEVLPENAVAFANKNRMKTFSSLQQVVEYAEIDAKLAHLFRQPETRQLLKDVLLARLFEIM